MFEVEGMGDKHQAKYEARAAINKALSYPVRLMIVDDLTKRAMRM